MSPRSFSAAFAAFVLLTTAPVLAQQQDTAASLVVNPAALQSGATATITYSNPGMAGQSVLVDIDNGARRNGQTAVVEIMLDGNGVGTAVWTVPCWNSANFNAPGVCQVNCPISR